MKDIDFERLPFNTTRSFVMAKTYNGCEIWIPTINNDDDFMKTKKTQLESFLSKQPIPPIEPIHAQDNNMKTFDPTTDEFEVVEVKRNVSLALIKIEGKLRYINRDLIPVERRKEYYEQRGNEYKESGYDGQA